MNPIYEKLEKCYQCVREKTDFVPEVAIILGSGFGQFADEFEEDENSYSDALDLEGATRQIELPKRNAKKEEDDFSLDFINLDE